MNSPPIFVLSTLILGFERSSKETFSMQLFVGRSREYLSIAVSISQNYKWGRQCKVWLLLIKKLKLWKNTTPFSYGIRSFRLHRHFVPKRFAPTFDQLIPNPLVDSCPTNYDTKCLKQTWTFISIILVIAKQLRCTLARARYMSYFFPLISKVLN